MKLATLKAGGRDGTLVVVSRDLVTCQAVPDIAPHPAGRAGRLGPRRAAPAARSTTQLNAGTRRRTPSPSIEADCALAAAARLPVGRRLGLHQPRRAGAQGARRPGAAVLLHRSADVPGRLGQLRRPARSDRRAVRGLGRRPRGRGGGHHRRRADGRRRRDRPAQAIRLVMLVNDVSLRNLIPKELEKGFGFFQSKPASAFSPVAVTPDELGDAWRDSKLHLPLLVTLNGQPFGRPERRRRHDLQLRPAGRARRQDARAGRRHHHRLGHGVEQAGQPARLEHRQRRRRLLLPGRAAHVRNHRGRARRRRPSCASATRCASRCWTRPAPASSAPSTRRCAHYQGSEAMKLYTYFRSSAAYRVRIALQPEGAELRRHPGAPAARRRRAAAGSSTARSIRAAWCRPSRTTTSR